MKKTTEGSSSPGSGEVPKAEGVHPHSLFRQTPKPANPSSSYSKPKAPGTLPIREVPLVAGVIQKEPGNSLKS